MHSHYKGTSKIGSRSAVAQDLESNCLNKRKEHTYLTFPDKGSILAIHSVIHTLAQISLLINSSCTAQSFWWKLLNCCSLQKQIRDWLLHNIHRLMHSAFCVTTSSHCWTSKHAFQGLKGRIALKHAEGLLVSASVLMTCILTSFSIGTGLPLSFTATDLTSCKVFWSRNEMFALPSLTIRCRPSDVAPQPSFNGSYCIVDLVKSLTS